METSGAIKETIKAMVQQVAAALLARKARLVTAESCTGGGVGFALTELAGSSAWYEGGFISYSNAAKQCQLQVPASVLAQYGAVSEQSAAAMAAGALHRAFENTAARSAASYSLAVTGIAGPGGGSQDKPVGTVCFAWCFAQAGRPGRSQTQTCLFINDAKATFTGERAVVREQAIAHALAGLLRFMQARPPA